MRSRSGEVGFTLAEILITVAVVGILSAGFVGAYRMAIAAHAEAERLERALLVAQDIYEEMRTVPFDHPGAVPPPGGEALPRPLALGSFLAYDGLRDAPVHDVLDRLVEWGDDLSREVHVRRFTPEDRARVMPPLTPPTGEYAEGRIEVRDRSTGHTLVQARFHRAMS